MRRYYITPKNELGQRSVVEAPLVDMTGVDTVDLPDNTGWLTVRSRDKEYPVHKIALAIAAGQIMLDDIS